MTFTRTHAVLALVGAAVVSAAFADAPVGSTIVASQGGVSITLDDLDAFAAGIPDDKRIGFFDSPTRIQSILVQLLAQKQMAADARNIGLDKDPMVQHRLELAEDETLAKARAQKFRADIKLPDFSQLAQEEFIAHKEKYLIKGRVDVKHVLIDLRSRSDEEAKKLAETVRSEAVAHPDQFDALIEKYSEDTSKTQNHGLMTGATDGKYVAEFAKAAAALTKKGEISPVVKTDFGYHVLMLVDRTQDRKPAFADIREQVIAKLRNDYIEAQVKDYGDQIRNRPVDANADLVGSLRSRYGTAPSVTPAPAK